MTSNSPRKFSDIRDIPSKRILINDPSQLPIDYSSTPGGTLYSTTPGGTRIIYDRAFLMQMRNSPIARTPPTHLPHIPGITSPSEKIKENGKINAQIPPPRNNKTEGNNDEPQFEMDI